MTSKTVPAAMDWRYYFIALLPALVFLLNILLLAHYAAPPDLLPERIAEFDAYKEATARIGVVATLMLFAGATLAALLFFGVSLAGIDRGRLIALVVAFLVLAVAALASSSAVKDRTATHYAGLSLACLAATYDKERSDAARAQEKARAERRRPPTGGAAASAPVAMPAGVAVADLAIPGPCDSPKFRLMQKLQMWQFVATTLAFSALVFGGILCLGGPRGSRAAGAGEGETEPELQHWERQSERLNVCLYLSALLLATSLMFINAFLRWPEFLLSDRQQHDAYVGTLVSYYGFTFTVMLASYYIPIAAILADRVKKLSGGAGDGKLPNAFKGPLQLLKIVLGLFSTSLAGVLPAVIDMIG